MALMQNKDEGEDDDDAGDTGAPDPEAYKSHSTSIVDILEDMRAKAEGQLDEERKAEMNGCTMIQLGAE